MCWALLRVLSDSHHTTRPCCHRSSARCGREGVGPPHLPKQDGGSCPTESPARSPGKGALGQLQALKVVTQGKGQAGPDQRVLEVTDILALVYAAVKEKTKSKLVTMCKPGASHANLHSSYFQKVGRSELWTLGHLLGRGCSEKGHFLCVTVPGQFHSLLGA